MGLIGSSAHTPGPIKVMSPSAPVLMRIEKRGEKWLVLPEKGDDVLGTHDNEEDAKKQLAAIHASQARKHERHIGVSIKFEAKRNDDGLVPIGVWDRGETFGIKPKDGQKTVFSVKTFGQFIDNWLGRGEPLSVCYNHQTAYVAQNGAPAPSLAFHDAVAMVKNGEVIRFEKLSKSQASEPDIKDLTEAVLVFSTDGDQKPSPDGLWWYRCEVTPLGQELLPNYKFLSPMFVPDGEDEYGNKIGYTIYDHAATNTAFQAGCMIRFDSSGSPKVAPLLECPICGQVLADIDFDGRLPNHVGRDGLPCDGSETEPSNKGAMSTAKKGGQLMARKFEEETRKKIGFEEGSDDKAIMEAFGKRCMDAVKKFEEESKKLFEADDVTEPEKMEAHKMSLMESVKKFEEEAKCLEADAKAYKDGFEEEPDEEQKPHVVMRRLARAYSRLAKMSRMESEGPKEAKAEEKAEEKKEEKKEEKEVKMEGTVPPSAGTSVKFEEKEEEEAKKELCTKFEIDPTAITFSRVLTHINAKMSGSEQVAALQKKLAILEQKDEEREMSVKVANARTFSRTAIDEGRQTEDHKELIEKIFIKDGEEEAKKFLFAKDMFNAIKTHTIGGEPKDYHPEPTKFTGVGMSQNRVAFDRAVRETMASEKIDYAKAMEIVFKKSPELYDQ